MSESDAERRRGTRRGLVDAALLSAGAYAFAFGLADGNPLLWILGAAAQIAVFVRIGIMVRRAIVKARSQPAIAARAEEMARFNAVQPARRPTSEFAIRLPKGRARGAAIIVLALLLILLAVSIAVAPPADADFAGAWVCGVVGVLMVLLGWRMAQLAVLGDRDRLIVRNLYSSRTFARRDVVAFDVGSPARRELLRGAGNGPAIVLKTRAGESVQLLATSANARIKGGRERLEPNLALLRGWLAGS